MLIPSAALSLPVINMYGGTFLFPLLDSSISMYIFFYTDYRSIVPIIFSYMYASCFYLLQ